MIEDEDTRQLNVWVWDANDGSDEFVAWMEDHKTGERIFLKGDKESFEVRYKYPTVKKCADD